jgi:hypothetical protein
MIFNIGPFIGVSTLLLGDDSGIFDVPGANIIRSKCIGESNCVFASAAK